MHPACTALLLGRLWPIGSLVAPCQAGASPLSVLRGVSPRAASVGSERILGRDQRPGRSHGCEGVRHRAVR